MPKKRPPAKIKNLQVGSQANDATCTIKYRKKSKGGKATANVVVTRGGKKISTQQCIAAFNKIQDKK